MLSMKQRLLLFISATTGAIIVFFSCKKNDDAASSASITALSCSSATFSATATASTAYSGTATVAYTGGNGVSYAAGSAISSTGVTGLTATLSAGTLASGAGSLTYTITGTPASSGTAAFHGGRIYCWRRALEAGVEPKSVKSPPRSLHLVISASIGYGNSFSPKRVFARHLRSKDSISPATTHPCAAYNIRASARRACGSARCS